MIRPDLVDTRGCDSSFTNAWGLFDSSCWANAYSDFAPGILGGSSYPAVTSKITGQITVAAPSVPDNMVFPGEGDYQSVLNSPVLGTQRNIATALNRLPTDISADGFDWGFWLPWIIGGAVVFLAVEQSR